MNKECGECKYFKLKGFGLVPTGYCENPDTKVNIIPSYACCDHFESIDKLDEESEET